MLKHLSFLIGLICLLHNSKIKQSGDDTFEITTVLNIRPIDLEFRLVGTETSHFYISDLYI